MTETTTHTMHCGAAGCGSSVSLTIVRKNQPEPNQFKRALDVNDQEALELAACGLGWRRVVESKDLASLKAPFRCTRHTVGLVCDRCGFEVCSCMGGPRFDVRVGDKDDE